MGGAVVWAGTAIGCAAMLFATAAPGQERPDSFDFAAERLNGWDLKATTEIDWRRSAEPAVSDLRCYGERPPITFEMNHEGMLTALRIDFLGKADADGDITLLGDHLWLYLDGERWEYANIPKHSWQFSNLRYPLPKQDEVVLGGWRGHQAIRRSESKPWRHVSRLYERLIAARRIEWGFKSRNWTQVNRSEPDNQLPADWQTARYPIDNRGLHDAVSWCERQIASKAAFVLPQALKTP